MAGDARVESNDNAGNGSEQPDPGKGEPKADKAPAGSPSSKSDMANEVNKSEADKLSEEAARLKKRERAEVDKGFDALKESVEKLRKELDNVDSLKPHDVSSAAALADWAYQLRELDRRCAQMRAGINEAIQVRPRAVKPLAWWLYAAQFLMVMLVAGFYLGLHRSLPVGVTDSLSRAQAVELALALDEARDAVALGAAMTTQAAFTDEPEGAGPTKGEGNDVAGSPETNGRTVAPSAGDVSAIAARLAITGGGVISPSRLPSVDDVITVTDTSSPSTGELRTSALVTTTAELGTTASPGAGEVVSGTTPTDRSSATIPVTPTTAARATVAVIATQVVSRGYGALIGEEKGAALATAMARIDAQAARPQGPNVELVDMIVEQEIARIEEPAQPGFLWTKGGLRYAEILFALFFGYAAFALMSSWKHLPDPRRPYWAAWHLSKVVSALILGFAAILLLQQINLVTPGGSDDSALGLGFAPMEIVFAVAVITGYFSNRMVEWLSKRATRYFGAES